MKGLLFNIQKFSLHDGPGIRTVIFFKGCPLCCKWCSNPESQKFEICMMNEKPDSRYYSIEETMKICLQDKPFYEESGGGITLSGGEVMNQPHFATILLENLRKGSVHTAIETSGFASEKVFCEISSLVDLLLIDIKHFDDKKHVEGTGVSNKIILSNIKNAFSQNIPMLARLPIIPGYNNSLEDARGFASLLLELGLKRAQLLPFHQFGERKYDALHIPYEMKGIPQLHREDLEEYKQIICESGIDCFF
jgi:pyruvate formate lyase activating enzyme